jgi:hypothetical protein
MPGTPSYRLQKMVERRQPKASLGWWCRGTGWGSGNTRSLMANPPHGVLGSGPHGRLCLFCTVYIDSFRHVSGSNNSLLLITTFRDIKPNWAPPPTTLLPQYHASLDDSTSTVCQHLSTPPRHSMPPALPSHLPLNPTCVVLRPLKPASRWPGANRARWRI